MSAMFMRVWLQSLQSANMTLQNFYIKRKQKMQNFTLISISLKQFWKYAPKILKAKKISFTWISEKSAHFLFCAICYNFLNRFEVTMKLCDFFFW